MPNTIRQWHQSRPWSRHSLILLTAGIAYIALGSMYLLADQTLSRTQNLKHALLLMPYNAWSVGFMVVGVIALISSRWPAAPKTLGYTVLTGWTAAWAGFYITGGLATPLHWSYVAAGIMWATLAFLWWAVSGLSCPDSERGYRELSSPASYSASRTGSSIVCLCHPESGFESQS